MDFKDPIPFDLFFQSCPCVRFQKKIAILGYWSKTSECERDLKPLVSVILLVSKKNICSITMQLNLLVVVNTLFIWVDFLGNFLAYDPQKSKSIWQGLIWKMVTHLAVKTLLFGPNKKLAAFLWITLLYVFEWLNIQNKIKRFWSYSESKTFLFMGANPSIFLVPECLFAYFKVARHSRWCYFIDFTRCFFYRSSRRIKCKEGGQWIALACWQLCRAGHDR